MVEQVREGSVENDDEVCRWRGDDEEVDGVGLVKFERLDAGSLVCCVWTQGIWDGAGRLGYEELESVMR